MWYYLIVALQIYCAYHAYSTRNNMYWYLVIFFAPGLGSLIYLITQVFTKRDADTIQKEITAVINPTKKVKDLEKRVQFSDTFKNRVELADAYSELGDYSNAIEQYTTALNGSHSDDFYANGELLKAYYQNDHFEQAVDLGKKLENRKEFERSKTQFIYGLALSELNKTEEAEFILKKIDQRYSNYSERLQLAEFLNENGKFLESKEILEEMLNEHQHMTKPNKRKHKRTFNKITKFYSELT